MMQTSVYVLVHIQEDMKKWLAIEFLHLDELEPYSCWNLTLYFDLLTLLLALT